MLMTINLSTGAAEVLSNFSNSSVEIQIIIINLSNNNRVRKINTMACNNALPVLAHWNKNLGSLQKDQTLKHRSIEVPAIKRVLHLEGNHQEEVEVQHIVPQEAQWKMWIMDPLVEHLVVMKWINQEMKVQVETTKDWPQVDYWWIEGKMEFGVR